MSGPASVWYNPAAAVADLLAGGGGGGGFQSAWVGDEDVHGAMKKNVASQVVGVQMVSATDGSAFTGSVSVSVTGDGGTQAGGGGSAPVHEGNGFHSYVPTQAETNFDHIAFTFTGTGAVPRTVQVYTTFPQTGDSFARLGAPAGASVSADIAAIEAQTDDIGAAGAGLTALGDARLANLDAAVSTRATPAQVNSEVDAALDTAIPGSPTAGSINERIKTMDDADMPAALTAIDDFIDTEVAAILAAVDTEVAAIKAKTDQLTFTVANRVDSHILGTGTGVFDAASFADSAGDEFADRWSNRNVAGGSSTGRLNKYALMRLINRVAIAAGVLTVYDVDDTTPRVTQDVTTTAGDPVSEVETTAP